MSDLLVDTRLTMNDGHGIPALGFGVFQLDQQESCEAAVAAALEAGYRHIDTAFMYQNEQYVGNALVGSGLPREDVFITTKTVFDHDGDKIREGLAELPEEDKGAVGEFGIEFAYRQCKILLETGVPGVHIYTMDRSKAASQVVTRLRADGLL